MQKQTLNTKELAPIKAQATKALTYSNKLKITNDAEEAKAAAELTRINVIGDNAKAAKEKLLAPHKLGMEAVKEFFAPVEDNVKSAVTAIKAALKEYYDKKQAAAAAATAKINAKVEKGSISMKRGVAQLNSLETVEKNVTVKGGGVLYKKVTKARVTLTNDMLKSMDKKELGILAKAGNLMLNEVKMKADALAGIAVFGAETYEDTQVENKRA